MNAKNVTKSEVKIGYCSVIAALIFMNKDVPPYAIVGGTLATILRFRLSEEFIFELE